MSEFEIQLLAKLDRLIGQLEDLPAALAAAQQQRAVALSREDREKLASLIPAISAAIGSMAFSTRDLLSELSRHQALSPLLQAALGEINDGTSRKLGKLLKRAVGYLEGGFRVECVGKAREGLLWCVFETRANS